MKTFDVAIRLGPQALRRYHSHTIKRKHNFNFGASLKDLLSLDTFLQHPNLVMSNPIFRFPYFGVGIKMLLVTISCMKRRKYIQKDECNSYVYANGLLAFIEFR